MPKNKPGEADVRYEIITQEDPETGDLIIPIPPPVLQKMGWKEGDEIKIEIGPNGEIYFSKG
jgi:hypothetical protein